jgi:hypothetical protein
LCAGNLCADLIYLTPLALSNQRQDKLNRITLCFTPDQKIVTEPRLGAGRHGSCTKPASDGDWETRFSSVRGAESQGSDESDPPPRSPRDKRLESPGRAGVERGPMKDRGRERSAGRGPVRPVESGARPEMRTGGLR